MSPRLCSSLATALLLLGIAVTDCLATCRTPWKYCGTSGSTTGVSVDTLDVANCCSLPCYLNNGQNVSVTVVFTANDYFDSLVLKLCGQLYGSCIDFPLEHSDICSYVSCPLQLRKQYKMKLSIFIKPYWQNVSTTAQWMLQDASGSQMGCIQLPVVITSSGKKPEYTPEADAPTTAPKPVTRV